MGPRVCHTSMCATSRGCSQTPHWVQHRQDWGQVERPVRSDELSNSSYHYMHRSNFRVAMSTAITWIKEVAFQEWLDAIICNKQKGGSKIFQVRILEMTL